MVHLDRTLKFEDVPSSPPLIISDNRSVSASDVQFYCYRVKKGNDIPGLSNYHLRATLVWSDPPSSLMASQHLVNDLDLIVSVPAIGTAPAQTYVGNTERPVQAGRPLIIDHINNVEQITIPTASSPFTTEYTPVTVAVRGSNVAMAPQPFALVITGQDVVEAPLSECAADPASLICPNTCSDHGTCNRGVCTCASSTTGNSTEVTRWAGDDCSVPVSPLPRPLPCVSADCLANEEVEITQHVHNELPPLRMLLKSVFNIASLTTTIAPTTWKYVTIPTPLVSSLLDSHPDHNVAVRLRVDKDPQSSIPGDPDTYVALDRLPTLTQDEFIDRTCNTCVDAVGVTDRTSYNIIPRKVVLERPDSQDFVVGLYGFCCSPAAVTVDLVLVRNPPDATPDTPSHTAGVIVVIIVSALFGLGLIACGIKRRREIFSRCYGSTDANATPTVALVGNQDDSVGSQNSNYQQI